MTEAHQNVDDDRLLVARRTFQLLGILTLLVFPALLFVETAELWREIPSVLYARAILSYVFLDLLLLVSGIGVLRLRRWAAATLSCIGLFCASLAAVQFGSQILRLRDSASLIGSGYIVLFALPALLTLKNWRTPIWR